MRSRLQLTTSIGAIADAIRTEARAVAAKLDLQRPMVSVNVNYRISLKCWLFGHDDCVRRASGRLYLQCLDCGRETIGWTVDRRPPSARPISPAAAKGPAADVHIAQPDDALLPA